MKTKVSARGGKIKSAKAKPKAVKKQTAKKTGKAKTAKRHFHVSYLALALVGLLILEALLFTFSSKAAWQDAVGILDVQPGISQTAADLTETLFPVIETVSLVNKFYSLATDAAMELLNLRGSETELLLVIDSVTNFYVQASFAMEELITITPMTISMPQVAGASISN